jgi:hypothetical protein
MKSEKEKDKRLQKWKVCPERSQSAPYRSFSSILHLLLTFHFCLFTLIALAACNELFNPIQQNDQYPFSIHGYLDASQDTNWVRITAVRDSLFMDTPEPLDAVATLEHLESGHTVTMNDSLFQYYPGSSYAYNFWTDMNIEPEQAYRLTVRRSDGAESYAEVTLPPEFPQPILIPGTTRSQTYLWQIRNVQHLADVLVIYDLILHYPDFGDVPYVYTFRHLADTLSGSHSIKQVSIYTWPHFWAIAGLVLCWECSYTIVKREIKVSSAGPDWLPFTNLNENLISLPEGSTNVEGGTGYLIGVISNTIEWHVE